MKLQEYDFEVKYIKGADNRADQLSKNIEYNHVSNNKIQEIHDKILQQRIIDQYHLASGHGSVNNLKFMITSRYKWSTIYKDIETKISECKICLKAGRPRINTKSKIIRSQYENNIWPATYWAGFPKLFEETNLYLLSYIISINEQRR